nr:zinc ribbon domain-containing protein [Candidatus Sigynarchaeota archaeon]
MDRFYPSSKMCSACGAVNSTLTLADRHWTCPSCGAMHDRDVNAATNIKREGLRILSEKGIKVIKPTTNSTAGTAGINASGNPARPVPSMARVDERRIHVL